VLGAFDAGFLIRASAALMLSSLLERRRIFCRSSAGRSSFRRQRTMTNTATGTVTAHASDGIHEAPLACVVPLSHNGARLCIVLLPDRRHYRAMLVAGRGGTLA
jgi:hypothetical protein